MISILQSVALGSPSHVQALAAIQRLSLRAECAEAAFLVELPDWLASNILRDCSSISDFSIEFGVGLLLNLSLRRRLDSPQILSGVVGLLTLQNQLVLSQVGSFCVSLGGQHRGLVTALRSAAQRTGMTELEIAAGKLEQGIVASVGEEKDDECYLAEEELSKLVVLRSTACPIDAKFKTLQPDSQVYTDFIASVARGAPEVRTFQRVKMLKVKAVEKKPVQLRIWR